jgi:hypothetical protein
MVSAKTIAKIRQRTLLALVVPARGVAALIGWAAAPGRCREALGRAMVRTSFLIVVNAVRDRFAALMSTIEGSVITV